jgi:hypothetical protein
MLPLVAGEDSENRSFMDVEAFGNDGPWDTEHLHSTNRFDIDLIETAHGIAGTNQSGAVFSAIAKVFLLRSPS